MKFNSSKNSVRGAENYRTASRNEIARDLKKPALKGSYAKHIVWLQEIVHAMHLSM